jgi:hypothetical protein
MPRTIDLLPTPVNGLDGFYRIGISFTTKFGTAEFTTQTEGWQQMEPHIKFIYPAARLLGKSNMELPDLNCTNPDIRAYINQARRNFEESSKNNFYNIPISNQPSKIHHQLRVTPQDQNMKTQTSRLSFRKTFKHKHQTTTFFKRMTNNETLFSYILISTLSTKITFA